MTCPLILNNLICSISVPSSSPLYTSFIYEQCFKNMKLRELSKIIYTRNELMDILN